MTSRSSVGLSIQIYKTMNKQAKTCVFQITIPVNMTAKFVIPKNCNAFNSVLLDGNSIQLESENGQRFIDLLGSGSHIITLG